MTATLTGLRIGAHVDQVDPLAEAAARGADLVQFFLGDPQGWKGPRSPTPGVRAALRAAAEAADLDLYVHAPYRLNVAIVQQPDPDPQPQAARAARRARPPRSAPRA